MPEHHLLRDLIAVFALALVFIITLARLRIPSLIAFVMAGVLAGPSGLAIVSTQEDVEALAEVGVILLLFTVGLDFSVSDMRRIWKTIATSGALQISLTTAIVVLWLLASGHELSTRNFCRPLRRPVEHRDRAERAGRAESAGLAARTFDGWRPPSAGPLHRDPAVAGTDSLWRHSGIGGAGSAASRFADTDLSCASSAGWCCRRSSGS